MISEQYLMRNLMRTCAAARRPHKSSFCEADKAGKPRRGVARELDLGKRPPRGFGHILDLLSVDEGMRQQQIAECLGIRPQSVSEAISAMESRGYIRRETSPSDRRVTLIYLTEEGLVRRAEIAGEREIHAKSFFAVLSDGEKEELNRLLEKLNCGFDTKEEEV